LLERGQKLLPDYTKLPRNAGAVGQTESRLD